MASRYEISAVFKMIDNMSEPMQRIAGSSSAFAKKMSADMQRTEMQIKAAGQAMKAMAGVAVAAGVALAGKTVVDSIGTYIEFEDAVTKAGSKFKDVDVSADSYNATLEKLQETARQVGAVTKFSATDAAGALDKMAMAGLSSEQSMAMLMGTTNLAAATGIDLTSAVDKATDAMGAFNLTVDKSGNPLDEAGITASMNRIADVVAKTTNMANLDMDMWFESVKMGASTFTSLGGTIEEFSAYVGTLANAGIKGSMAGNALKNIMLNLSAPAKSGAEALKELGIRVFDLNGQMLPINQIMQQFETNLAGVADEKKAALLKDIFGKEQISAFNVLLQAGSQNLGEFTNQLENAGGTAEKIAQAQSMSFQGLIEQLKSAVQDKQLSIGKAFEVGGAKEALQGLITYVQNFDVAPIAAALTQIMQAIPSIVSGFVSFVQTLWSMREIIEGLVIAWGIYKVAVIGALIYEKVLAFMNAIKAVQLATEGMSVAQAALNVVMNANPIGLIITAIGALIAIIILCVKHWDEISAAVSGFWEKLTDVVSYIWESFISAFQNAIQWIQNLVSVVWNGLVSAFENLKAVFAKFQPLFTLLLGPVGVFVNIIVEIVKNFDRIKAAFTDGGFVAGIKTIGQTIISALLAPIQKVLEVASKIPGIGGKAKEAADAIAAARNVPATPKVPAVPIVEPPKTNTLNPDTFDYYKSLGGDDDDERPVPVTSSDRLNNTFNAKIDVGISADRGLRADVRSKAPNSTLSVVNSASY